MTGTKIDQFLRLADQAVAIRDSDATDWQIKFDLIFSDKISLAIRRTEVEVDWVDPDTTYEADVRTFVDAVEAKASEIRKALTPPAPAEAA